MLQNRKLIIGAIAAVVVLVIGFEYMSMMCNQGGPLQAPKNMVAPQEGIRKHKPNRLDTFGAAPQPPASSSN